MEGRVRKKGNLFQQSSRRLREKKYYEDEREKNPSSTWASQRGLASGDRYQGLNG